MRIHPLLNSRTRHRSRLSQQHIGKQKAMALGCHRQTCWPTLLFLVMIGSLQLERAGAAFLPGCRFSQRVAASYLLQHQPIRSIHTVVIQRTIMSASNNGTVSEYGAFLGAIQVEAGGPSPPRKVHHVTVCMVPHPDSQGVWNVLGQMRRQLQDPGYYRWPPHANLLYPFLELTLDDNDILVQLHAATRQVEPFSVVFKEMGTFGGNKRGVLWLHPASSRVGVEEAPLLTLHKHLEEAFPMCKDQAKNEGVFTPHVTLSHLINLDDALTAKQQIEQDYPQLQDGSLQFTVDRIYLLRREGDEGQFLRLAEIGLGANSKVERFKTPQRFPDMPTSEDPWVHKERMKLKATRNGGNKRRGRIREQPRERSRGPRIPDSPEVIAAKREARKAKREQLEREQLGELRRGSAEL
jgi:2'-5' RNA ligase